ncbi:hypothetical protein QZH41_018915 [Actinostola sp. cb2023]|nr:hypothetical protein QZH41_018915 [Actinostola sp. cb2023]
MPFSLQNSAKICDLQTQNQDLIDEIHSLKQKHEFEVEVKTTKIKALERELKCVEGELHVTKDECVALKSTIAQMTAQSQLNLQSALSDGVRKANTITDLRQTIHKLEDHVNEKDGKLREEETLRRKLHNTIQELKGNIRVYCRIRPPLQSERKDPLVNFVFSEDNRVLTVEQSIPSEDVTGSKRAAQRHDFTFDKIFSQTSNQSEVFEEISQLVQSALDGYNVCIFAYGQTGSGKTFTMEGDHSDIEKRGMIPRSMEHVFETSSHLKDKGWNYKMEASFLEIYNENIRDLLGSGSETIKHDIKMVNNGTNGESSELMVTNLKVVEAESEAQVSELLKTAAQNRAVAATKCNERSSRSHSVFILKLRGHNSLTDEKCQGILNLVDLAGSERLGQSCSKGERLKETKNINSSLSTLSNVIMALANKESHIPYRNSKLTYLLKNSLGGNSKSLMFVNISPREDSLQETVCSLRFATKVNHCNIGKAQKKVVK